MRLRALLKLRVGCREKAAQLASALEVIRALEAELGRALRTDLATKGCVVCGKPPPGGENVPGWSYLAGSRPLGAVTCSADCLQVALASAVEVIRALEAELERHRKTGRVDLS